MESKFRRWAIVGFLAAIMIFSFFHLSSAGTNYQILTTSDSGFFYGIARDTNEMDGLPDVYELSHPPQGHNVPGNGQLQPIMLVMLYRGLHSLNPSVSLMDACRYFSPLVFTLALIGIFLAGRELGGDLTGGLSALFMGTLAGSIYWTKIGAFDREVSLIFFGAWMFYFTLKLFNSDRQDIWKYSIISGLVYGLFLITWPGGLFIAPIPIGGLILVLLFKFPSHYTSARKIENAVINDVRENVHLICGIVGMFVVATLLAITIGDYQPDFWIGFAQRMGGFLGLGGGGGGLGSPRVATEMAAPTDYWKDLNNQLFRNMLLMKVTLIFASLAVMKVLWTRKKHEFLLIPWLIVPAVMATSQARFFRVFWPMWPVLAAYGAWTLFRIVRRLIALPTLMSSKWLGKLRQPIAITVAAVLFTTPLVFNARANATETYPYPHGGTAPAVYHSLVDSYNWIEENTPENSVIAVEWSYGHLLTGTANRYSVTDGATTTGIWDNHELPPPDYVQLDVDGDGKITAADDVDGDGQWEIAGGRRPDMQSLYSAGENEFERIIRTYRDNYGLKIDYVVFNLYRTSGALWSSSTNEKGLTDYSESGGNLILQFENYNYNVWYNRQAQIAYYQEAGTLRYAPVLTYELSTGGTGYYLQQIYPEMKVLQVFYMKGELYTLRWAELPEIPMVARINWDYQVPTYLDIIYESPQNYATVGKINHIPSLTSPENGEVVSDNTPTFEWARSIGGEKYELVVDNNPDFSSPEVHDNVATITFTPSNPLPEHGYYWRVRAFNKDNNPTSWTKGWFFTLQA